MTIKAWVDSNNDGSPDSSLSLSEIQAEFGGTAPTSLSEYYRGLGLVPANATGTPGGIVTSIPSSGYISISNFYAATKNVVKFSTPRLGSFTYIGQTETAVAGGNTEIVYQFRCSVPDFTDLTNRRVFMSIAKFDANPHYITPGNMNYIRLGSAGNAGSLIFLSAINHWDEGYVQAFLTNTLGSSTYVDVFVSVTGYYVPLKNGGVYWQGLYAVDIAALLQEAVITVTTGMTSIAMQMYTSEFGQDLSVSPDTGNTLPANNFVMLTAINDFSDGVGSYLISPTNLDTLIQRSGGNTVAYGAETAHGFDQAMSSSNLTYSTIAGKQTSLHALRVVWSNS